MSAFMQSDDHISYILAAAHQEQYGGDKCDYFYKPNGERRDIRWREGEVGQILKDQNARSVNFRYADSPNDDTRAGDLPPFVWMPPFTRGVPYDPVKTLMAIDGFSYQASETPDWRETEAWAILHQLRARAIKTLPGYDDAGTWSI
jgi:hypothetical protein